MRIFTVCAALALAGCPGPEASEGEGEGELDGVVATWAEATCAKTFACFPGAPLSGAFGNDEDDCISRIGPAKQRSIDAPGAAQEQGLDACAAAISAASCDDFSDSYFGDAAALPECWTLHPGSVPEGEPCAYGAQCETSLCGSLEGACGSCVAVAQEGQACGFQCDPLAGLVCGFDGICHPAARRGQSCNATTLCTGGLSCVGGTCTENNGLGDACDPNAGNCRFFTDALICNNQTFECERWQEVDVGDDCGLGVESGGLDICGGASLCDTSQPSTPNPYSGTCVAGEPAALGEACAYAGASPNGSACADSDARCVNGKCVVDDPTTCN